MVDYDAIIEWNCPASVSLDTHEKALCTLDSLRRDNRNLNSQIAMARGEISSLHSETWHKAKEHLLKYIIDQIHEGNSVPRDVVSELRRVIHGARGHIEYTTRPDMGFSNNSYMMAIRIPSFEIGVAMDLPK